MTDIRKIEVPDKVGEEMLANILQRVGQEPNSVPLPVLVSYSNYRRERFSIQRLVIVIVFIIFLLLPFFFIRPNLNITDITPKGSGEKVFRIDVESIIPISTVTATSDNYKYQVTEEGNHVYKVVPLVNGEMDVTVTAFNYQYKIRRVMVTGIDTDAPYMVKHEKEGDNILVYVKDDGSGIDFENITTADMDGNIEKPKYDEEKGIIYLSDKKTVTLFVPDLKGNKLQLVITMG